ncbi:MAG: pyridoxal-phosphate dependent enzyme [Actinomycetia bacterium]|nr:pyridoxal-phosphate dependent enzyme [Actinomycetes bacterium]
MILPTYDDVIDAANRISRHVHHTPVFTSAYFDRRVGASVHFKAENLQKVGAFKARGAMNAVLSLTDEDASRGVVTHSSGNHGQALANAARVRGIAATIVMPHHAPAVKVAAVRGYGATIVFCDQAEREAILTEVQAESGATLVHPFDDAAVIAGQGTASLEFVAQVPDLDVIVAPIGGGGLLSGASIVGDYAGVDVVGAEPDVVDDSYRSLRDGVRHPATGASSIGDGLLTGIGELTFAVLHAASRTVVTVSDEEMLDAMGTVASRMKLVIEPSSGAAVAAILKYSDAFHAKRVGVILSGGNVQLSVLGGLPAT